MNNSQITNYYRIAQKNNPAYSRVAQKTLEGWTNCMDALMATVNTFFKEEDAKRVGHTLGDVVCSIGGLVCSFFNLGTVAFDKLAEKISTEHSANRKRMLADMLKKIEPIPAEFRQNPSSQIVRGLCSAAESCLDEDILRNMFASLLASTFDSRKQGHPSFAQTLTLLSPLDAENLILFKNKTISHPVVQYVIKYNNRGDARNVRDVFLANKKETNLDVQALSISVLSRLGLISLRYSMEPFRDDKYIDFDNLDVVMRASVGFSDAEDFKDFEYYPGKAVLTPYGVSFLNFCMPLEHILYSPST